MDKETDVMKKKKTGLAAFAQAKSNPQGKPAQKESATQSPKKKRGQGALVALTVRLLRDDWERLHQLAVSEGATLQGLALRGFSAVLEEKGLPPI